MLFDHGLTVPLAPSLVAALRKMVQALTSGDFDALSRALAEAGLKLEGEVDIMTLLNLVGVLLGKEQSGENEEEVDAFDVGMRIGKSVGSIPTDLLLVGRTSACSTASPGSLTRTWTPWRLSHITPNAPSVSW